MKVLVFICIGSQELAIHLKLIVMWACPFAIDKMLVFCFNMDGFKSNSGIRHDLTFSVSLNFKLASAKAQIYVRWFSTHWFTCLRLFFPLLYIRTLLCKDTWRRWKVGGWRRREIKGKWIFGSVLVNITVREWFFVALWELIWGRKGNKERSRKEKFLEVVSCLMHSSNTNFSQPDWSHT